MKTTLRKFTHGLTALLLIAAFAVLPVPSRATDLTYDPAAPQTGDSDLIIAHKNAVALASINATLGAAILAGSGQLIAGEAHVGEVGGNAIIISPTVTTTNFATPYSAGDVVGAKLTLTNAVRVTSGSGVLDSIYVQEKGSQAAVLDILIFNADPSNGTYTDNGAFTANDTDMAMCIARIHIAAADYVATGGYTSASLGGLGKTVVASGSANLYAVIITSGTPTYAATTSLKVRFGFKRN